MTMLHAALRYASRGFAVIALQPSGKLPITEHGLRDATTDAAAIAQRWQQHPSANIGIACERSQVVVIDEDHHGDVDGAATLAALVDELGPLPETCEAVTGGGGRHLLFQVHGNIEFFGKLGPGVDIKHDGYIVVAPSVHPSGEQYRWIRSPLDQMPAPLPPTWLERMRKTAYTPARAPIVPPTSGSTAYGRAAVEAELEALRTTPKGERNNTLNATALKLGSLFAGDEIDDVREAVVQAAMTAGLPENEARRTTESGWLAGLATPRTAPPRERRPKTAITAITAVATVTAEAWSTPEQLAADVGAQPYPVDALPPIFRGAIDEVHSFVQAPVAMVAMSAIGAGSTAVQGLVNVQRTEGLVGPCSLYLLVLAPSGERKSTIDSRFSGPVRAFEQREAERCGPIVSDFNANHAAWEAKKRGLESKIEKASKDGRSSHDDEESLRQLAQNEPKPPKVPAVLYADATMEALAYGVAKCWPSACIQSSEAGSVFGAHTMGKDTLMRTLSLYNVLWDGASVKVHRRLAGGSYLVKNARLTMNLQVQPGMFVDYLKGDRGLSRESGFLARLLLAYPESSQGTRRFREPPTQWPGLARFNARIGALLDTPVNIDEDGGLRPVILTLTPEAKAAWISFHDRIEDELRIGGSLCDVRDVAAKAADNACRLAAIFQVFEHGVGAIGLSAFESAARIVEWHLNESRRFLGDVGQPIENVSAATLDRWLLAYCQAHRCSAVSVSTVQKAGPIKLRGKAALEAALADLADLGRARLAKGEGKARTIQVNPALLGAAVIAVPAVITPPIKKVVLP